jgi:hypothetical protein
MPHDALLNGASASADAGCGFLKRQQRMIVPQGCDRDEQPSFLPAFRRDCLIASDVLRLIEESEMRNG